MHQLRGVCITALGALLLLAMTPAARAADTLPAGTSVDEALAANITPSGLSFMAGKAKTLVPAEFPIPDQSGSGTCQEYNLFNAAAHIEIKDLKITPEAGSPGRLVLDLKADAWGGNIDSPSGDSTMYNYTLGRLNFDFCLFDCSASNNEWSIIRMFPPAAGTNTVDLSANLYLELKADENSEVPVITVSTDLDVSDVTVNLGQIDGVGCSAANIMGSLLNCCLSDVLEGFIAQEVVNMVYDEVIPQLQDALNQTHVDQVVTLQDAEVHLELYPSALDIRDDGLTIVLASLFEAAPPKQCTPEEASGSRFTHGDLPTYYTTAPQIGPYHAAVSVSDDMVNQALYAAWEGGLLCMDLQEFGGEPLDASFLALAGMSGALRRMDTPETAPLSILIRGHEAPWVDYGGDHLINLKAHSLELGLMTEVHGRMARIVALDLAADAGADLDVAPDGLLEVLLDLSADNITAEVSYDEVVGAHDAAALPALIPVMLDSFLPDLDGLIPEINVGDLGGVGLEDQAFVADGPNGDFMSAYTRLVETSPGCDTSGGALGDCGFNASCSLAGNGRGRSAWATLLGCLLLFAACPLGFVWWRRRQSGEEREE